jgi:hypothetical protein
MDKYEHVSSINNIKPKHCKYTQCNVFVNRVFLHTLFLYVICVNVGFKILCCMLLHVPTLNKTF